MEQLFNVLPILGSFLLILLVLFAAWYGTRWYARRMASPLAGRNIRILDRASLSSTSSLVIAKVSGRYYLLGVSDHSVNLLRELPDFEEPPEQPGAAPSFQKLFERVLRGNGQAVPTDNNDKGDGGAQ